MRKQFFTALVVMMVAAMAGSVTAATDDGQRDATVNVTIAQETAIGVHPQRFTYETVQPGNTRSTDARSFAAVELENVGSTEINRIWVNATKTDSIDAFYGSNNPKDFDAANFMMLKPNPNSDLAGDTGVYNYINRKELGTFNDSLIPEYIEAPDNSGGSSGTYYSDAAAANTFTPNEVAVGRFRMGDDEYFWAMPGLCDGSSGNTGNVLLVAKKPHNSTQTIPVDFTADGSNPDGGDVGYNTISGRDYDILNITGSTDYGATASTAVNLTDPDNGAAREYDIITECDRDDDGTIQNTENPLTIRTRYNVEAGTFSDLATNDANSLAPRTQYLLNVGDASSRALKPGEATTLDVQLTVPRGVPQGIVSEGTLRVIVSTTVA